MKYASFFLLLFAVFALHAQDGAKIQFNEQNHDFGTLQKGDPAEVLFTFTNTSEADVQLTRVKASCGCTTPSWTRDVVKPGATGEIKVKYNTNRVGPFTKSVTVTYDSAERPVVLYIRGKVEGPENTGPSIAYQEVVGGIAFDKTSAHLGRLDSDQERQLVFNLKNISPLKIDFKSGSQIEAPEMFEVSIDRPSLTPGQTAKVTVKVLGDKFEQGGVFNEKITLYTSEQSKAAKVISISGNIKLVLSEAEKAMLPNIEFETVSYDAGKVLAGEKVTYAYRFTNTGKNDLLIESVKASCGCTATAPKDKVIKGGESSEIVATFDSRGRRGKQSKSITVKTNDPDNPTMVLRLSVEVEEDPFHANDLGPVAKPGPNNR